MAQAREGRPHADAKLVLTLGHASEQGLVSSRLAATLGLPFSGLPYLSSSHPLAVPDSEERYPGTENTRQVTCVFFPLTD